MRLIDADYLLKELEDWQADIDDASSDRQLGVTDAIVIACQIPTVDAIPIEYIKNQIGRWERSKCESYHAICYRHLIEEWEMENERKED